MRAGATEPSSVPPLLRAVGWLGLAACIAAMSVCKMSNNDIWIQPEDRRVRPGLQMQEINIRYLLFLRLDASAGPRADR